MRGFVLVSRMLRPAAIAVSLVTALANCSTTLSKPAETAHSVRRDSTIVVLLGTGTPYPDPKASGPATAVVVGKSVFLFDAGPGVMRQMEAAQLPDDGVTALFVTHLHSDHTLGYSDLIFTSWVMGRDAPLQAYGPHGLQRMTDRLIEAYAEDIKARTEGLQREAPNGYMVSVHEIVAGVVYDSGGVRVTAVPVQHDAWVESYAYRIDTPDRSVFLSGDTRYNEALINAARGVDVLVHEVYPAGRNMGKLAAYFRDAHTSDLELGKLAAKIRPRLLILSHIVRVGDATDRDLLRGVRQGGFTGRTVVGHDLARY